MAPNLVETSAKGLNAGILDDESLDMNCFRCFGRALKQMLQLRQLFRARFLDSVTHYRRQSKVINYSGEGG